MSNSKKMITQISKIVGKSINAYYPNKLKSKVDDIKFKEAYQGRIIDCMVGEVDDNYIETPETDAPIVKLEYSKEGVVKVPSIKGKTILTDPDGNETDTPGEGCRLVSVGEDEDNKLIILSKNKNLFDGKLEHGHIVDGILSDTKTVARSINTIKVESNTNYKISFKNSGYRLERVVFYNSDGNYIGLSWSTSFTTPIDCYCVRFAVCYSGTNDFPNIPDQDLISMREILFEEGDIYSSYVQPQSHKTEILLDEPLRSLPNGVCDEIVGNQLIRRIGEIKLNGKEETWRMWTQFVTETHASFYVNVSVDFGMSTYPNSAFGNTLQSSFKSNFFNSDESVPSNDSIEGICVNNASPNYIGIRILKERLITPDVNGFKQWLSNNLVEIIFQLEEPIIEELPNRITLQGFDDTTMYIENSITPTVSYGYNALIPYKEELLKQREEVKTNTLDIENNIIPYLMDMEYNLMLMEGDINGTKG